MSGSIKLDGEDIYDSLLDVVQLRARVGMVFQKPNPFPKSIYDNVAYGPRIHGLVDGKRETEAIVERSLEKAGLWNEVKDRLEQPGTGLSGGQQQRLCIARAIAVSPEVSPAVILMDEPCSSLDPIATARIARMTIDIYSSDSPPPDARLLSDAFRMSTLATRMLHDVLDALARLDVDKAIQVARGDIELDSEFQAALRRLSTYIMEDARNVGHTINVTFIVKSLERIGDHAKNIAEYVVFLVKGKDVRHVSPGSIDTEELDR